MKLDVGPDPEKTSDLRWCLEKIER
jgi:hypothetical protein